MSKQLLRLKAFETTWGTTPAVSPADMVHIPVQTCDFAVQGGYRTTASLGGGRNVRKPTRERRTCGGAVNVLLSAMAHGYLLNDLLGLPTTTDLTGKYQHVWKPPASLPVGASFELGDTTGLYDVFAGMRCGEAAFTFNDVGPIEAAFTYAGQGDTTGTSSLDSNPGSLADVPFDLGDSSLVVKVGDVAFATLILAELRISNDPRQPRYYLGGQGIPGKQPMGRQTLVSGRIQYDPDDWAFYAAAKAGTESSLEITVQHGTGDGTAGNEYFGVLVPELVWHIRSPSLLGEDDEPMTGEAEFTAYLDNATEATSLQLTLKNTHASYAA